MEIALLPEVCVQKFSNSFYISINHEKQEKQWLKSTLQPPKQGA